MTDAEQSNIARTEQCSGCMEEFPAPEAVTVQWADVVFCSQECKDKWVSNADRRLR